MCVPLTEPPITRHLDPLSTSSAAKPRETTFSPRIHFIRAALDTVCRDSPRRFRQFLACTLIATACVLTAIPTATADVLVVTDQSHPVNADPDVRVIELDAPVRMEEELAADLPSDAKQATAIVWQRLKIGGEALNHRLALAYQGVLDAWRLGIVKLPAVVVDRQYVVYGEPDVKRAVARINEYRSTHL